MKKIIEVYICDNCGKELSGKKIAKKHLSISISDYSGWVGRIKEGALYRWRHLRKLVGIKQFCDGKCLGEYFDKLKDEKRKI